MLKFSFRYWFRPLLQTGSGPAASDHISVIAADKPCGAPEEGAYDIGEMVDKEGHSSETDEQDAGGRQGDRDDFKLFGLEFGDGQDYEKAKYEGSCSGVAAREARVFEKVGVVEPGARSGEVFLHVAIDIISEYDGEPKGRQIMPAADEHQDDRQAEDELGNEAYGEIGADANKGAVWERGVVKVLANGAVDF